MTSSPGDIGNIVAFDDRIDTAVDHHALLGGKGAGLVEMTQELGLPVPPGFTITTAVCRHYLRKGWPGGLKSDVDTHLDRLAARTGRRFGDPDRPLLVSVRSGAPVSMPGMMDTLLNVGMTARIRDRLAEESGDPLFAADTWLRFCRMYAEIVLDLPRGDVASAASSDGSLQGKLDAAERVRRLSAELAHPGIPTNPRDQLRSAVEAVFRSWNSDRARVFRARENVSEDLGTAVTIQSMVFGNLDDRSGTGVVFTRDPATGERTPFGDYLPRAQGEDVVAGTHAVSGLEALHSQLPEVHGALLTILDRLEHHYRDVCDVEFTVAQGTLYVLQTRIGRRSPLAAVRIAVSMAEDPAFPLTKREAVARIEPDVLRRLSGAARIAPGAVAIATGRPASPGVGVGVLCCDPDRAAELATAGTAVILAREETSPADVHGMVAAAALLTTTGGVASHAAVVARGWGIPAATGVSQVAVSEAGITVAGTFIPCGETVTVDGSTGSLFLGDQRSSDAPEIEEVRQLRQWAAELGVEPGAAHDRTAIVTVAERSVSLLEVARTIQLKGLCPAEKAGAALGTSPERIATHVTAHPDLFRESARGLLLTPAGRTWVQGELDVERQGAEAAATAACYEAFSALNLQFKKLVSEWQIAGADGHSDDEIQAMLTDLAYLHGGLTPVLANAAGYAHRLHWYSQRFASALAEVQSGDLSMLASPLKDSYHTVWFEYHEELISLCGRDRLAEERAAAH